MPRVHITGVGGYLPERILSNQELAERIDTTDSWIVERTGIRQRHIIAENQCTSDLAVQAAKQALDDAGILVGDLDALVVATTTPDMVFPSTAAIVQSKLGASGFPVWDIQAVCAGFVYGLAQIDAMIRAGMFRRVLLVGTESMSRILDWNDRSTCVLFGDGAGAVVLEIADDGIGGGKSGDDESDEYGVLGSVLKADGAYRPLLMARHPHPGASPDGSRYNEQPDMSVDAAGVAAVEMHGNEVFRNAVNKLGEVVGDVLAHCKMEASEIDWLIPHQANIRIIQATARKLKLDSEHIAISVDRHANTSSASVPLALNAYYREGRIEKGQVLLLEAFGAGFVWGANLIRWGKDKP